MRTLWLSILTLVMTSTSSVVDVGSRRPDIVCHPHQCPGGLPVFPERRRLCYVKNNGNGQDDSQHILSAIHECNYGGRVVFRKGVQYTIGTALDLTFMNNIDIDIQGYIQFTNDTTYWQEHSFQFIFQNATSFWLWGGKDVAVYGGGTIDGNGQTWYNLYAVDPLVNRPTLIGLEGLHNSVISNLNLRQSPTYHFFMANSTNVIIDNMNMNSVSSDSHPNANTDGIDLIALHFKIGFKPNSTNMLVQNMHCTGSHGISVGSLGQYPTQYDIIENIYVYNVSMVSALTGARVKVWPNTPSTEAADLQGGGGSGIVNQVTFDTFTVQDVDYAIELDQCYGQKNLTLCYEFPSPLKITNVVFKNFQGITSTKYEPDIATFACSSDTACSNIHASNINVWGPGGSLAYCQNVDELMLVGVNCTGPYKGFE
ncbi:hypothetical protein CFD26_101708 [Aspergillus turcosus]|uniref:galacturonan 1,4-alpha-galacturonidase n=1 Tax=Aspergillus turcosus TaxID=1245748 RepID=A0A421CZK3_9EURO|nr:hypothetical protein CFD26_101708 [Aspergillus turcosus]